VTRAGEVSEPALKATIVDLTGAGDAFAAGYLAGLCRGYDARGRVRLGHSLAARVVTVRGDIAVDPESKDQPTAAAAMRAQSDSSLQARQ
jgi:2-dehydro-3-deoxygluconokinase